MIDYSEKDFKELVTSDAQSKATSPRGLKNIELIIAAFFVPDNRV